MLSLQAEGAMRKIFYATLARKLYQRIGSVELDPRLGRQHFQYPPRSGFFDARAEPQRPGFAPDDKKVIVPMWAGDLRVTVINVGADWRGHRKIEVCSL